MKAKFAGSSILNEKVYYCFFLFLSWIILIYPLIDTKLIPGHDYVFHVTRILDVAEAIKTGVFPVRMYVDDVQFWGTPVGIFYPGLFNYIPVLLKLAGVPVEVCYNVFIALIILLGFYASWYGFSLLTRSRSIGFFSAILYISSGYYLIDAYIRNALGELLGLSFMPLAMACIERFIGKEKIPIKIYIIGLMSISAVIQSHVLSSVFLAFFGIFNLLVKYKKNSAHKVYRLALLVMLLFFLNAHFIIPFLVFYKSVPVSIDFVDMFSQSGWPVAVTLQFLILWSFWLLIALSFFFSGIIHKLALILKRYLSGCCIGYKLLFIRTKVYVLYFLAGFLFLFMSTSAFPWDDLHSLKNVFKIMQFPLRFLGIATLCFCICGGFGIRRALRNKKLKNVSFISVACLICITSLIALYKFTPVSKSSYWTVPTKIRWVRMLSTTDDDYLYKDMDVKKLFMQGNRYVSAANISNYHKHLNRIVFSYDAKTDTDIILPLVNYPGYTAVDQSGREIKIEENDNHMIVIPLTKGTGHIQVWYKGLLLFKIADYISLVSLFLFLSFIFIYKRKRCNNLKN